MILPPHAFYGRGSQTGPILFLTDDSSAERNALELCYPKGIRLLCTFHILQAFWRWIYDSKHNIKKEENRLCFIEYGNGYMLFWIQARILPFLPPVTKTF